MVVIVEIVIHEEIGVTPLVCLEHLKGQGHKLTVAAKIVKQLGVGLGLGLALNKFFPSYLKSYIFLLEVFFLLT